MKHLSNRRATDGSSLVASSSSEWVQIDATLGHLRQLALSRERTAADRRHELLHSLKVVAALSRDFHGGIQLFGRIKGTMSTLRKMLHNCVRECAVLDIIGIRAVAEHTHDCYRLIRRIHIGFPVLPSEYDDYIAKPKSNGYRSLHTTVVSPRGFPIEIQIRTHAMHVHAERGAASHIRYKQLQDSAIPFVHIARHDAPAELAKAVLSHGGRNALAQGCSEARLSDARG